MNSDDVSGTVLGGAELPSLRRIRQLVAERVRSTPGVVRLEPTLQQSISRIAGVGLRRATARRGRRGDPDNADGVHVVGGRGEHAPVVRVEVVISGSASIVEVGQDIRAGVTRLLIEAGYPRPRVDVAVLSIEY